MWTNFFKGATLILICLSAYSCKSPTSKTLFNDLTAEVTGIDFVNRLSNSEDFNMVDYLYYYDGGGVAVGDINNDGLSDIYLVSNEGDNELYLNLGGMKFQDISISAGVQSHGLWKSGVSMADVNGDGWLDIYLCRLGDYKGVKGHNELYINQGDLTFKEEASTYNLDFSGFATQAAFFDLDNDGDLDAYLLNHSVHNRRSFGSAELRLDIDTLAGDRIYRNEDNLFEDISESSGIYRSQIGYGLGIGLSDINADGYTDVFISNDFIENDYLYLNNRDGSFTEVFSDRADNTSLSSMGCDLADFNNDGFTDILVLDMLPANEIIRKSTIGDDPHQIFRMKQSYGYMPQYKRNTLQLNRGDGTFSDIGLMAGIYATDWSWAPLLADFDNDGWKDIFISNGIPGRPNDMDYLDFIESNEIKNNPDVPDSVIFNKMPPGKATNYFFRNNRDLTFEDHSAEWGVLQGRITNGIAYSDLDNDGDLDLVLNNLNAPATIKENTSAEDSTNHYLTLELSGANGNTHAIGAKVEVYAETGYQLHELFTVRGFKSSVDPRLHIGLGGTDLIDSLRISWPGGGTNTLHDVAADQNLKLAEDNVGIANRKGSENTALFAKVNNKELGVDYVHSENTFIEFNREPLLPHMHSREGPALVVADLNNDGLDDFFVGGAKHQAGSVYLQQVGGFAFLAQPALEEDKLMEDVDADVFDYDKDGDMDLVIVSGGNEFDGESPNRSPRLYKNDGSGNFEKVDQAFSGVFQTGSCVAIHDFDGDGWEDVFFGNQVVPWNYGLIPQSYLLKNEGGKSFIDVSALLPNNGLLGMINDAMWVSLDGKDQRSLVLAGEWMDVTILEFNGEGFEKITIPQSAGWWMSVAHTDYEGDGDQDLLMGNLGMNSKLKAMVEQPIRLYLDDFDRNGKLDAVMTTSSKGEETIFTSREVLETQFPSLRRQFPTAKDYAEASLKTILGGDISNATVLEVNELRSGVFINENGTFRFQAFPNTMQIRPIRDFLITDINADERFEIISVGNLLPASMQEGRYAAGRGTILFNTDNTYQLLPFHTTGFSLRGDTRKIRSITVGQKEMIMTVVNNDSIQWMLKR